VLASCCLTVVDLSLDLQNGCHKAELINLCFSDEF
jgi:hypothetical protein